MPSALLLIAVLVLFFSILPASAGTKLLDAIAQVESSNRPNAVGDHGHARGAWQMHAAAWDDVSAYRMAHGRPIRPYSSVRNAAIARSYARDYLIILQSRLARRGINPESAASVYLCWNLGFDGAEAIKFDVSKAPLVTQNAIIKLELLMSKNKSK